MKRFVLPFCAVWLAFGCTSGNRLNQSEGVPAGAGMNAVTSVTAQNDTLQSGTADKSAASGEMRQATYEGLLPSASGSGIVYRLTVCDSGHSGSGTFRLTLTYKGADNGRDMSFSYKGRRLTKRGIPGDSEATVWQCVSDDGDETFNFLKEDETTLTLLGWGLKKPETRLNYSLKRKE